MGKEVKRSEGGAGDEDARSEAGDRTEGERTDEGAGEEKLSLEQRLRRLDEIVSALEGGDVELDRGLELFEEGVRHIRRAEQVLAKAELKVEELVGRETALETRPIHEEEGQKGAEE